MRNEFTLAFNEVIEDKQLPKDVILEAIQAAMVSAYRRAVNASNAQHIDAVIDPDTGSVQIFAEKEVVDEVEDERTEVSLMEARMVDADSEIGSMVIVETTPKNFGRVAAQTARQVIQQRIREAERDVQEEHYSNQVGEIVSGVIQAINQAGITLGLDLKAEGLMPRNQMISGERFRVHDRIRALLLEVKASPRGPQIILSRSHKNFLRRLLENEVPEIYHGLVEIRSISREPGHRSKVAVSALQPGIDPVGACVGIRGVRIQAIVRELNDEKIDVIEWNPDPTIYIAKALSPARVSGVYLNEYSMETKTATVVVPEDQLSLAIGRDGQNARLAAKLTGWRIDIKSLPEAVADALYKVQNDPEFALLLEKESENLAQIENILAKKSEGRPVTPEEYQFLTHFVDRVERGYIKIIQDIRKEEEEKEQIALAGIPKLTFEIPLSEFEISDRLYTVISEAECDTVGDLMLKININPDSIYKLQGMGPKSWSELEKAIEVVKQRAIEQEKIQEEVEEEISEVPIDIETVQEDVEVEQPISEETITHEDIIEPEIDIETPIDLSSEEVVPTDEAEVIDQEPTEDIKTEEMIEPEETIDSFEEIFKMDISDIDYREDDDFDLDEDDIDDKKRKKRKKKKKKFVEIEYDPDSDVTLVKKKRKREEDDTWEDKW